MTSLWKIPDISTISTPAALLKEQATALTDATRGLLKGEVRTVGSNSGEVNLALEIVVPALNNYRYAVLYYTHPVVLYPGVLHSSAQNETLMIQDSEQLRSAVGEVLGSDAVARVIGALAAQANQLEAS